MADDEPAFAYLAADATVATNPACVGHVLSLFFLRLRVESLLGLSGFQTSFHGRTATAKRFDGPLDPSVRNRDQHLDGWRNFGIFFSRSNFDHDSPFPLTWAQISDPTPKAMHQSHGRQPMGLTEKTMPPKQTMMTLKQSNHVRLPGISLTRSVLSSYLGDQTKEPNGDEDEVSEDSLEDVAFVVNLASVDLVEQGHQDEVVEDDCEVFARFSQLVDVVVFGHVFDVHPRLD